MEKIRLIFGTYNRQPVGSTGDQLEKAYINSYRPFLKLLYKYPKVKATIHYTGVLLEWFEEKHPEIILLMNDLIKRGQVEMLGGAFYNPILPVIPSKDRITQIEYLTTFIRKHFGKRPRGCWIPEKNWEPVLSSNIKNSGMEFTFLDEDLFRKAGINRDELNRVYITEDQGKILQVFPINSYLSEAFDDPHQLLKYLKNELDKQDAEVITMMIDGDSEKSAEACTDGGWFELLFQILSENTKKIQTINPGKYVRTLGPLRKVYLPCTTSGRYFRQYFTKYAESNLLYSKMMYMHNLANHVKRDKTRKKNAREEIMKSQCHSFYWHDGHSGIYDNTLRKAAYKHLINAEKSTREKGIFTTTLSSTDFDFDGSEEFIYQGQYINAYVHRLGGMLFELDYLVTSWNYLDTMARYREEYHTDEDEKNGFDNYPRKAFVDHFFEDGCTSSEFSRMTYKEAGTFIKNNYSLINMDRDRKELELQAKGHVFSGRKKSAVRMNKVYDFKKNSVEVTYTLENLSSEKIKVNFAPEINLSLNMAQNNVVIKATDSGKKEIEIGKGLAEVSDISEIIIQELKKKVTISLSGSENFELWQVPVATNTKVKDTVRNIYQSTCFLTRWAPEIEPSKRWSASLMIKLEKK